MAKAPNPFPAPREPEPTPPDPATLAGELGIRDAEDIRRLLVDRIESGGRSHVDLGGVTAVDTSIIQVLLAAARSGAERDCTLEFAGFDESALPAFMTAIGLLSAGEAGTGFPDIQTITTMSEEEE